MAIIAGPFADYCNISFPWGDFAEAEERVLDVAYSAGGYAEYAGLIRLGKTGVMKHGRKFGVGCVSASGDALAALRGAGLFREWLSAMGLSPHRVTFLHATVDVVEDGARAVHRIYRRALRGKLRFTRKSIPTAQVSRFARAAHVDGRQTGTVYLGHRRRDVSAKVYDKRNQLLDVIVQEHGADPAVIALNDPGPLTRYELQFGRHVGVTLADVDDPSAVFWHHAGDVLLPRPAGVREWVACAEGFEVAKMEVDHMRQLELLLENSPDVHRMVRLADTLSPREGRRWLCGKLARLQLPGDSIAGSTPVKSTA